MAVRTVLFYSGLSEEHFKEQLTPVSEVISTLCDVKHVHIYSQTSGVEPVSYIIKHKDAMIHSQWF